MPLRVNQYACVSCFWGDNGREAGSFPVFLPCPALVLSSLPSGPFAPTPAYYALGFCWDYCFRVDQMGISRIWIRNNFNFNSLYMFYFHIPGTRPSWLGQPSCTWRETERMLTGTTFTTSSKPFSLSYYPYAATLVQALLKALSLKGKDLSNLYYYAFSFNPGTSSL